MNVWGVITGIAIGVAGTAVVWIFKTYVVKPRLSMSEQISRREEQGTTTWRIKLGNYSWLPATDLSIHAVLRTTGVNGSAATTVLAVGLSSESIDVLRRRARGKSGRHRLVYLDPASLTPFGVRRLPEALRRKVQDPEHAGPIELEDLLRLGSKASLTVTAFCFNGLSGTRKWFSRTYTINDITTHSFKRGTLACVADGQTTQTLESEASRLHP
jgi:hypothetical protein